MNGLPVLIGFGGFKVYRFVTEGAHCKFGLGNRVENVLACEACLPCFGVFRHLTKIKALMKHG